jgi:hypothetical protein
MTSFSLDTLERTARTVMQSSAAAILALWIQAGDFSKLDWSAMWQVAVFSAGFTVLTALAAKPVGDGDSASVLK